MATMLTGLNKQEVMNATPYSTNRVLVDPVVTNRALRAFAPREVVLVLYVNGNFLYFSADDLSWDTSENIVKLHGTGRGEGLHLLGTEIDHSCKFSVSSFVGESAGALGVVVDSLTSLLRLGADHRAAYFGIQINLQDYGQKQGLGGGVIGDEGSYLPLLALQYCKIKSNGVSVSNALKTSYDADFLTFYDLSGT